MAQLQHKFGVLRGHCEAVGRDYAEIEKSLADEPHVHHSMVGRRHTAPVLENPGQQFPAFIVVDDKGNDFFANLEDAVPVDLGGSG